MLLELLICKIDAELLKAVQVEAETTNKLPEHTWYWVIGYMSN